MSPGSNPDGTSNAALLLEVVSQLEALSTELTRHAIVQAGVDIAQRATRSRIAYLHFLNDDQNTIELGVWSHDTLKGCTAVYDRHYPIASAGIWADSARSGAPCVHNDYASQAGRRGLPLGHSQLIRHLGVPVLADGVARMLVGVGNKPSVYDAEDLMRLELVARRIWSVVEQRRVLEHYLDRNRRFQHLQQLARVCGFEYDVDADHLGFDAMYFEVFDAEGADGTPASIGQLLERVAPADRLRVREVLVEPAEGRQVVRVECLRASGQHFPAELKVEFRPREIGAGYLGVGILQDVSVELEVDALRRRADHDPLTGLPNRSLLESQFDEVCGGRRPGEALAFHYLDLDDFKPVNDRLGHEAGDTVLRVVAERLLKATRQSDLVARMGGDEFVVLQTGVQGEESACRLASKLVAEIGEPIDVGGQTVKVGASVGVALVGAVARSLHEVRQAADRALYRAKSAGGHGYVLEPGDAG